MKKIYIKTLDARELFRCQRILNQEILKFISLNLDLASLEFREFSFFTPATLTNVHEKIHDHNFIPPDTRNHSHFTRNRNQLAIPLLNRDATQKTFVYQEIVKLNALSLELKDIDKKPRFKKRAKDFLLSSY